MAETQDIEVLREMVRLAENRRTEALEMIERLKKYNIALIAFAGSFLSLLITVGSSLLSLRVAGGSLVATICFSLYAVRPQRVHGGALNVASDVSSIKEQKNLLFAPYLLEVAELTNNAATTLHAFAISKQRVTTISALFLAFSLIGAYILYAYA